MSPGRRAARAVVRARSGARPRSTSPPVAGFWRFACARHGVNQRGHGKGIQLDIDPHQDLRNLVVQLAADSLALLLLGQKNLMRQASQLRVQPLRFASNSRWLCSLSRSDASTARRRAISRSLPGSPPPAPPRGAGPSPPVERRDVRNRQPAPIPSALGNASDEACRSAQKAVPVAVSSKASQACLPGLANTLSRNASTTAARRSGEPRRRRWISGSGHAEHGGPAKFTSWIRPC